MFRLNPLTIKKIKRFRSIKRAYFSLLIFVGLVLFCFVAELFVNHRALLVRYKGKLYFPTYGAVIPGEIFGLDYKYETEYKKLQKSFEGNSEGNFVIMPIIPYGPSEILNYTEETNPPQYPPYPPDIKKRHLLGTDKVGRDILARLVYGFRIAIGFALILLVCNYTIGITIGCAMGYIGGPFDLFFQRIIEVWSNIPFLYTVIILSAIISPGFFTLAAIMVFFGWMGMTWYMRTSSYREKSRDYVMAARAMGASNSRIILVHIIPNTISVIVTFIPFSISGAIVSLTSLDYLGYGLPPSYPSWGELLRQGTNNLDKIWIVSSVVAAMVFVLFIVNLIGEGIREAFDPKKFTYYE